MPEGGIGGRRRRGSVTFRRHELPSRPSPSIGAEHGGDSRRHQQARGAVRPDDDAGGGVAAAKQVFRADRSSVWLHDLAADELVLEIATGIARVRVPASTGIVGAWARAIIKVPDCYADTRFNREADKASGYRTRCMLALPLIGHKCVLVKCEAHR